MIPQMCSSPHLQIEITSPGWQRMMSCVHVAYQQVPFITYLLVQNKKGLLYELLMSYDMIMTL